MKTVYLCGAINGCNDEEAKGWRERVKHDLAGLYCFLDPMRRDYRGREDDCVAEIVSGDLKDISESDIVLVAADRPSWGTAMEAFHSWTSGVTVVTVCGADRVSPWLRAHADVLVPSLADAITHLKETA